MMKHPSGEHPAQRYIPPRPPTRLTSLSHVPAPRSLLTPLTAAAQCTWPSDVSADKYRSIGRFFRHCVADSSNALSISRSWLQQMHDDGPSMLCGSDGIGHGLRHVALLACTAHLPAHLYSKRCLCFQTRLQLTRCSCRALFSRRCKVIRECFELIMSINRLRFNR